MAMTARDFCYWLQGYFEVCGANPSPASPGITPPQAACIQRHLSMVFAHEIDPAAGPPEHQQQLNNLHRPPGVRC
jgi:hypothetical protein